MVFSLAIAVSLLSSQAAAHTYIWVREHLFPHCYFSDHVIQGVYVNGVDQGTGKGIRTPAYNGAPGKGGYNNGPVKDLTSIDMRCNVMGDIQASDTIKVMPGDNLTFDWYALHHFCGMSVNEAGTTTTATTQTTSSPTAITVTPLPFSPFPIVSP